MVYPVGVESQSCQEGAGRCVPNLYGFVLGRGVKFTCAAPFYARDRAFVA